MSRPASMGRRGAVAVALTVAVAGFVWLWRSSLEHWVRLAGEESNVGESVAGTLRARATLEAGDAFALGTEPGDRTPATPIVVSGTAEGSVTLLEPATRQPPSGTVWRFAAERSHEPFDIEVPADGRVTLGSGTWSATCRDPDYSVTERFEVVGEATRTLWVRHRRSLRILVTGGGAPVAGARVRWAGLPIDEAPGSVSERAWSAVWSASALTDSVGRVELRGVVLPAIIGVTAEGRPPTRVEASFVVDQVTIELPPIGTQQFLRLDVVDAQSGARVSAPAVVSWAGQIEQQVRGDGKLWVEAPRTVDPDDFFEVRAPGFCSTRISWADGLREETGLEVRLFPSCALRFDVRPPEQLPARVICKIDRLPAAGNAPWLPDAVQLPHSPALEVPIGAELEVAAWNEQGSAVLERVRTVAGENVVTLLLGLQDSLVVEAIVGDGRGSAAPEARVWFNGASMPEVFHARTESLRLPRASHISSLFIAAAGCGAVMLRPRAGSAPESRVGRVQVEMRHAHQVLLRLLDADGQPVPGMDVSVVGRAAESERVLSVQHPEWTAIEQPRTAYRADGAGLVRCQLVEGVYSVRVSVPVAGRAGRGPIHYPVVGETIAVDAPGTFEVLAPRVREVVVTGLDAVTGEPLAGMSIQSDQGSDRHEVPGHRRELWLADSCREIVVASKGYVSRTVEIGDADSAAVVRLLPGGSGTLLLEGGDIGDLAGATLTVQVVSSSAQRWRTRVILREPVSSAVFVAGQDVEVEILPVVWKDRRWLFEPLQAIWNPGARLRFRVRAEPQ